MVWERRGGGSANFARGSEGSVSEGTVWLRHKAVPGAEDWSLDMEGRQQTRWDMNLRSTRGSLEGQQQSDCQTGIQGRSLHNSS